MGKRKIFKKIKIYEENITKNQRMQKFGEMTEPPSEYRVNL